MERQYRILLLEDEPLLRVMLAQTLVVNGYRVVAGGSLEEGETILRILGWDWPDAVLSDVNLSRDPEVRHGYLFHARWRARHPVPPFVFMIGNPDHSGDSGFDGILEGEDQGEEEGEDYRVGHILKPFAPSELLRILAAGLAE